MGKGSEEVYGGMQRKKKKEKIDEHRNQTRSLYAAIGFRKLLLRDLGLEGAKSESGTLCQPVTSGICEGCAA